MSVSLHTTIYNWLRELKIPVSKTYLKQQLLSHPYYPSLLSITDILDELEIKNVSVRIDKEQLYEIEFPFLVFLKSHGGEFVIIKNKDQLEEFLGFYRKWNGVVIAAEKPTDWIHKSNIKWIANDSSRLKAILFTLLTLIFFIFLSAILSFDWKMVCLNLVAIVGLFISWAVVHKDLGIENKVVDQVCGADADCSTVIQSSGAKLPFGLSWSDAGIIYFPFLLIALTVASFSNSIAGIYSIIGLVSLIVLPITIVSVYYQWKIIKKWCRLCLITISLLWVQFIVLPPKVEYLLNEANYAIVANAILTIFLLFICAAAWLWLKPLLKKTKELEEENFALTRFRKNPDGFQAILEKQKKVTINPEGLGIVLGNPRAENTIIKVCNPYCGPCAEAHPKVDELLAKNENLKVQIIFTAQDDDKDMKAKPVKHLMSLYDKNDKELMMQALNDWYLPDKKDFDVFAKKYVLNGDLQKQGKKLRAMREWCDNMKIETTPTFFVNGYQLPVYYDIDDVKYFLS